MFQFFLLALTWQFIAKIPFPAVAQQQCYYPSGSPADSDLPCGDGVNHSHCCGSRSICLSNKLCLRTIGAFELSRASCTDRNWRSANCPNYCTNVRTDGGAPIALYSLPRSLPPRYCCGMVILRGDGLTLGCYGNPNPFTVEPGDVIADRGIFRGYVRAGSGDSNSSCSSNSTCPMDMNSNTVVALGAGLGVPLGIISIAALSWAFWERFQRRKVAADARLIPTAFAEVRQGEKPPEGEMPIPFQRHPAELRHDRDPVELS